MRRRRRSPPPPFSLFTFQDIITCVTAIMILVTMLLALDMVNQTQGAPPTKTREIRTKITAELAATDEKIKRLEEDLARRQGELLKVAGLDPDKLRRELSEFNGLNQKLEKQTAEYHQEQKLASQRLKEMREKLERYAHNLETAEKVHTKRRQVEEELARLKSSNRVIFNRAEGSSKRPWLVEVRARRIAVAEVGRKMRPEIFSDLDAFARWAGGRNPNADWFVLLIDSTGIELSYEVLDKLSKFELGIELLAPGQTAIDADTGAAAT